MLVGMSNPQRYSLLFRQFLTISRRGLPMKARVIVTLKPDILDPQGKAIEGALRSLGLKGIASVRQGKVFDIELAAQNRKEAAATLRAASDKLLANSLIETYDFKLL
jgi:phosphoribosylformylglycinamidine synthase subunit PurS